jgi:hypothetical protein
LSRTAFCCCLFVGAGAVLGCGAETEGPGSTEALAVGAGPSSLVSEDPAAWTCQRYGDVADESGDSYDSNAVRSAEQYLVESVRAALTERGIDPDVENEVLPARWAGLLSEVCVEWPDLLLEAAAVRVAEALR